MIILGEGVKREPKYDCRIFEQPLTRPAELQDKNTNGIFQEDILF